MSISIQDFNTNFRVQVRNISIPHVDETGTVPAVIGFNVICLLNNRVQYFEYHFTDAGLVTSSTTQELIDYAWTQLKSDVNTWATTAIAESNLLGYVYVPTTNFNISFTNMDLSSYNQNFTTRLARFEVYPYNDPNSWCVGFTVTNNTNNIYLYIDTNVQIATFSVTHTESDIMNTAWDQVKDQIGKWASEKLMYSALINTNYIPSTF